MEIQRAKEIMGRNFIGAKEIEALNDVFHFLIPEQIPEIEYDENELLQKRDTHVLILCISEFLNGESVNIKNLKKLFATYKEPCFYNQDWYNNEKFINLTLSKQWILVSKTICDDSRGVEMDEILRKYKLFSAIELTYSFFVYYIFSEGERLWECDYVWCSDKDDKGDQIYVGRYKDASGFNSDGFEIHRHLRIKNNYGAI